jgi:hypothetical protein
MSDRDRPRAWVFVWGAGAVLLSLLDAIVRLSRVAYEGISHGMLSGAQLGFTVVWTLVIVYGEGYRAFGSVLAPRMAARLMHLSTRGTATGRALAPLHALSLFDTPPRRLFSAWVLLVGIVTIVLIVRKLPQPWRGSVDLGVVLALTWGSVAIVRECVRAWRARAGRVDPELANPPST